MKKLIITLQIENIKEYGKKNNKASLVELDYDIQQIIVRNKVKIEDVESSKYYLGGEECYKLIFTIEDITEEQRHYVIEEIDKIIDLKRFVIEENKVEVYDLIRIN